MRLSYVVSWVDPYGLLLGRLGLCIWQISSFPLSQFFFYHSKMNVFTVPPDLLCNMPTHISTIGELWHHVLVHSLDTMSLYSWPVSSQPVQHCLAHTSQTKHNQYFPSSAGQLSIRLSYVFPSVNPCHMGIMLDMTHLPVSNIWRPALLLIQSILFISQVLFLQLGNFQTMAQSIHCIQCLSLY